MDLTTKTKVSVDIYKYTGKYYISVHFFSDIKPFESRDQFLEEFKENFNYGKDNTFVFTASADFGKIENKFVIPFQIEATLESTSENQSGEFLLQNIIDYAKHHQYTIEVPSENTDTPVESIEVLFRENTVIIK